MINKYSASLFLMLMTLMNSPAYAVFEKVTNFANTITSGLVTVGPSLIAAVIAYIAVKMILFGATWQELLGPILGGLILTSATLIANMVR